MSKKIPPAPAGRGDDSPKPSAAGNCENPITLLPGDKEVTVSTGRGAIPAAGCVCGCGNRAA